MLSAETIMKRWLAGVQSPQAKEKFQQGVEAVTESPMEAAANAQDRMLRNVTASVVSGLWANRLRAVSLASWKQITGQKGGERLASGARQSEPKMRAHVTKMAPVWANIKATIRAMPKDTEDQALERVRTAIRMQKEAVGKTY
jgi:hypothetical protein